ncbi:unnamed protein product [Auanema sp. JU1783]|nr:unnamed protein product [Auanema sp. JU1783]
MPDLTSEEQLNFEKLAEGKTKEIFGIHGNADVVLIRSKDQLTAFNAARKSDVEGKGRIANKTTTHVFQYLNDIGIPTHFVASRSDTEFLAQRCEMIPIEWVARRIATGSFLKRNPGVKQGYRFSDPKIETFFKDDEQDDPQWSDEQIISAGFKYNSLKIGKTEVLLMKKLTSLIFRALEKAWSLSDCSLIDMKIEFGVNTSGKIILSDVIDNDSWRVWPSGDKRLQLDKQFFREMPEVTSEALSQLISNYEKVMNLTEGFLGSTKSRVLIIMGSSSDMDFCRKIEKGCQKLGMETRLRISSAHKSTSETLEILSEYEQDFVPTVVIAVAGRSNGLGLVIGGNTTLPVINCPPPASSDLNGINDVWSSLRTPSGIGCSTVLTADEAALAAAKILSQLDHMVFGRILGNQLQNYMKIYEADTAVVAKRSG